MLIVPRTPTPTNFKALPNLISPAFRRIGHELTATQAVNLTVLVGIETGRGEHTQNHNVGNITANEHYTGAAWRPTWYEASDAAGNARLESLHLAMLQGKAPSAFRAYASLEDGVEDFARVLVHSFPEVLEGAKQSDANTFRLALAHRYSHDYDSSAREAITHTIASLQHELGSVGAVVAAGVLVPAMLWLAWRTWFA